MGAISLLRNVSSGARIENGAYGSQCVGFQDSFWQLEEACTWLPGWNNHLICRVCATAISQHAPREWHRINQWSSTVRSLGSCSRRPWEIASSVCRRGPRTEGLWFGTEPRNPEFAEKCSTRNHL